MRDRLDHDDIVTRFGSDEEYDTLDEAIVAALAELDDGGRLDIHEEHCELNDDESIDCTCAPMVLVKGAQA